MPRLHSFKGLRVGIVGAGRSGLAAARYLLKKGAVVLLSDGGALSVKPPRGVKIESGGHTERLLDNALLIRSPGVPDHLPILQKARQKGIPIWGELELAARQIHPKRLIAITGTNGKTTTTTLTGKLFQTMDRGTLIGGNIGTPLSELADRVTPRSTVVLEVSSYQLENIESFHPTISSILNITPDHLEHHGTMEAYAAAKARIFENQRARDVCVLNADDEWCQKLARTCRARVVLFSRRKKLPRGVYWEEGEIVIRDRVSGRFPLRWRLPGQHNLENALAAVAMASAGGVPLAKIQRVLQGFRGVEHRLEEVLVQNGVRYVNDSKATNVDSTRVALESFTDPLIVIMGGRGKGVPYTGLRDLVREHAQRLLLIGEDAKKIEQDLSPVVPCEQLGNMERAVARAREIAREGNVVLLSPACASFDQYKNYEERGRDFKQLVKRLVHG